MTSKGVHVDSAPLYSKTIRKDVSAVESNNIYIEITSEVRRITSFHAELHEVHTEAILFAFFELNI